VKVALDRYEELNIVGKGRKGGTRVWIIGECKAQLKKRDVDNFFSKLQI